MNQSSSVPDPIVVPLQPVPAPAVPLRTIEQNEPIELRSLRVEEFLQARSLAPNTQKAYRQDLQQFLTWTNKGWAEITPRHITQFKAHLLRQDLASGCRILSDTTVRRILGTLKNFYGWMMRVCYLAINPTVEVELPKLTEPEAQNLQAEEVAHIYQAVTASSLPERNLALISVLLHGLRAEEVCALNVEDYDGRRLHIREAKADSKGFVPLTTQAKQDLEQYLQWRQAQGEVFAPDSPLFISHSRRSAGQRLGYDSIRKLMNQLVEQTGIEFHAHRFRHTFATTLVLKGMNPYHAMTLTRHRSVQNFRRYTKAADQAAAEAAFEELISNSGTRISLSDSSKPFVNDIDS